MAQFRDAVLARYLAASIGALALDLGAFLALMTAGLRPAAASAAGYALGIAVHWLLSSRAVFGETVARERRERYRQKALFVGSALVGLAVTWLVVKAGTMIGAPPLIAKFAAIGLSFAVTWVLRRRVVFA